MTVVSATKPHPIFLAGRWVDSPDLLVVDNPATPATPAGATYNATEAQYEEAVEAAVAAFEVTRKLPAYERGRILREISAGIRDRREELGRLIATEAGKPIRDALVEVDRASLTFRLGAEEAERITGEVIPLDLLPSSKDRVGITRRFPIGPIAGISPFNFPLNLAAHKIAPAIASGNPIVLKPPSKDPLTMLAVAEIIEAAGAPAGSVSHPADDPRARRPDGRRRPVQAPDLHRLAVGRLADEGARRQEEGRARARRQRRRDHRQDRRPRLGGQALPGRAPSATPGRCASASSGWSSTRTSGTSSCAASWPVRRPCRSAIRSTRRPTSARWSTRRPPAEPSAGSTRRSRSAASSCSAGSADGTYFPPTVLTDVPLTAQVCSNEAFAPLVVAFPFRDLDEAIARVNDSHVRAPDRRLHQRPVRRAGGRSASSRSAASSSTTSRPTGSTTCPTAASRTPAWAARACAGRSRT